MPASLSGRRGVTLLEVAFFAALGLILLVFVLVFYSRTSRLFDTGARTSALQVDARKLFENLTREVRSAFVVTHPLSRAEWQRDHKLVLYRFASGDTRQRLGANLAQPGARDYPFTSDTADDTSQLVDCLEIVYGFSRETGIIGRGETGGYLDRTARPDADFDYSFTPDPKVSAAQETRTVATHVTDFEVTPLALVADPAGPGGHRLATVRLDGSLPLPGEIALLAIRFRAEDRPPDRAKAADEGVLELVTKIWLDERYLELAFPGSFSSIDSELEY